MTAAVAKMQKRTPREELNYDALEKGTWLETDELEKALLVRRTDKFFSLRVMNLLDKIERKTGILGRAEGAADAQRARLMTDAEALEYKIREAGRVSRKLERIADQLADNIDRTKLDEMESVIHDHARRMIGAMADAQKREKRNHAEMFRLMAEKTASLPPGPRAAIDPSDPNRFPSGR